MDVKDAEEYAQKVGGTHVLTSAKANKGVDEAFMDLTKRILEQKATETNIRMPRRQQSMVDIGDSRYV